MHIGCASPAGLFEGRGWRRAEGGAQGTDGPAAGEKVRFHPRGPCLVHAPFTYIRAMADDDDAKAQARAVLRAPSAAPDPALLGAVHTGLLAVPADAGTVVAADGPRDDALPQLAIRRRTGF